MVFRIKSNNKRYNIELIKYYAKQCIYIVKLGTNENILNQYLLKKYKLPLISACVKVINNAKFLFNNSGEVVVTFPEKTIDELASLITFGTGGKIQGSNILRLAFDQEY